MHYRSEDHLPKGWGKGLYKGYCGLVEESDCEEVSSDDAKDESDSETSSAATEDF